MPTPQQAGHLRRPSILCKSSALNRPNEVRLHVHGALNNGLTLEEIRKVMMQVAIYCAKPAGLDSMKVAAC